MKTVNMKKLQFSILILLFGCIAFASGQEGVIITGKVLSSFDLPVEGAVISATGAESVTTGADGTFSLNLNNNIMEISVWAEGYFQVKQLLGGRNDITVMLTPQKSYKYNESLVLPFRVEESRQSLTSAVNIAKKDFKPGSMKIDRALSGQVAGLQSTRMSGMPGEGSYMNLRGIRSFIGANAPLIVINGVPYLPDSKESQLISGLTRDIFQSYNIYDIQNITVLKGAEASMYGSLGSNGVVLIETDGAASNDLNTRVSFYGQYGSTWNNKRIPLLNNSEYQSYLSDVGMTYYDNMENFFAEFPFLYDPADRYNYLYNNTTDWQDLIYRDGFVTDNLFRIEGGDAIAKYDLSLGYSQENGILVNTGWQRYNTQLNTNILVSKKVEIFTTVGLAYITGNYQEQGMVKETNPILSAYMKAPVLSPYRYDQYGNRLSSYSSYYYGISENMDFAVTNPLAAVHTIDAHNRQYDMNMKAGINYRPTVDLSFSGSFGLFYNFNSEHLFLPGKSDNPSVLPLFNQFGLAANTVKEGVGEALNFYYNLNGRYAKTFNHVHRLNVVAGMQTVISNKEYDAGSGRNTKNDFYQTLSSSESIGRYFYGYLEKWNWMNMYAHADYTYADKVAVALNMAVDGASSAGNESNLFSAYPSVGLTWLGKGWLPLSNSTFVNRLNLRAEYGLTGNSYFSSNYGKYYYTSSPFHNISGIVRANVANTKLRPETNAQLNLSLEAGLFRNRLNVDLNYYRSRTSDVIMPVPQSSVFGTPKYYDNLGVIDNSGFELALQVSLIRERDFEWIIGGNITQNKSIVKSLGGADQFVTAFADGAQVVTQVGEQPYQYYGYQSLGVFTSQSLAEDAGLINKKGHGYQAGDIHYLNYNDADNKIDDKDRVVLGSSTPDFFGGFYTDIRVKSVSLSAEFVYSKGNQAYNAVRRSLESLSGFGNQTTAVVYRWNIEEQQTDIPRAQWGDPIGNNDFSNRWIEDASYVRMKQITLSYSFDKKILNFFRAGTLYVSGENLLTFTNYLGLDPEFSYSYSDVVQGFDYAKLMQPKSVKIGVNLQF